MDFISKHAEAKTGNESQCDFMLNNALSCLGFLSLFLQCQWTPGTCCLCLETEKLCCASVLADAITAEGLVLSLSPV